MDATAKANTMRCRRTCIGRCLPCAGAFRRRSPDAQMVSGLSVFSAVFGAHVVRARWTTAQRHFARQRPPAPPSSMLRSIAGSPPSAGRSYRQSCKPVVLGFPVRKGPFNPNMTGVC